MAEEGRLSAEERVRRGVGRTLANVFLLVAMLAGLGSWASFGFYTVEAGQQAVVLRFGQFVRTEVREGLHFHLPRPIEAVEIVNVDSLQREEFGMRTGAEEGASAAEISDGELSGVRHVISQGSTEAYPCLQEVGFPSSRDFPELSRR